MNSGDAGRTILLLMIIPAVLRVSRPMESRRGANTMMKVVPKASPEDRTGNVHPILCRRMVIALRDNPKGRMEHVHQEIPTMATLRRRVMFAVKASPKARMASAWQNNQQTKIGRRKETRSPTRGQQSRRRKEGQGGTNGKMHRTGVHGDANRTRKHLRD